MSDQVEDANAVPTIAAQSQISGVDDGGVQLESTLDTKVGSITMPNTTEEEGRSHMQQPKKRQRCRFYGTKRGCRAGDTCPFLHDRESTEAQISEPAQTDQNNSTTAVSPPVAEKQPRSQVIPKQPADARLFQINQIVRRFQAKQETTENGITSLTFSMPTSDPDFPFDIEALECVLKVPPGFPKMQKPSLRVTNKEMERGYQINVERGFDAIWSQATSPTLLNAMKALDKQLEVLLTAQKAEIVKLVANAGIRNSVPAPKPEATVRDPGAQLVLSSSKVTQAPTRPTQPIISPERKMQAKEKRETEVQMLEHRLGRSPQFSKAADGTIFTVPIDPRKRNALPSSLQPVRAVQLLVPLEYDIEPCTVELMGVEGEAARNVSASFLKHVCENLNGTLLAHINYLAQNMHMMAAKSQNAPQQSENSPELHNTRENGKTETIPAVNVSHEPVARDTDREHIKIIQRPPEWDENPESDEGDESTDDYDSEYDTSDDDHAEDNTEKEAASNAPSAPREKGVLISFPGLELHGIELLELIVVSLSVKCERCKDAMDVSRVKPQSEENATSGSADTEIHSTSCKKCANSFSVGYRKDLMHSHSIRAGYLDLEGCTVVDLLPSTFLPTCAECSTPASANGGVVSVRGESSLAICRSCHRKMNFRIPEVKFLNIGPSSLHNLPLRPTRKPKKESLGIVAGTELPDRGRCTHYAKSYRWFRFSCCNTVYPCDKCHDKATDHPNEFANRMICGWCSREQHYRPEDCIHCRKGVTGRAGSGFWEGGKGTRDRARMSRKDPRKYKRRGGGAIAARNK